MASKKTDYRLYLSLVFLLGLSLRLFSSGSTILYWDEPLHCVRIAAQSLPFVLAHNDGSAFFTLLVHLLIPLGKLEFMVRLPSILFGAGTVLATYELGKELFSKKEGLLGAFFVSLSPLLIRFSQYSRSYSTFAFFSLLSFYFFLKAVRQNQTKHWIGFCLATVINLYNHLFAFLLLPVYGIYAGSSGLRGLIGRKAQKGKNTHLSIFFKFTLWTVVTLILIVLLYLPDQTAQTFISSSLDRVADETSAETVPPLAAIELLKYQLAPEGDVPLFVMLGLMMLGLFVLWKREKVLAGLTMLYVLIPYTIFILIKPSHAHMVSLDRYMSYLLPLLLIFLGKAILTLSSLLSSVMSRLKALSPGRRIIQNGSAGILILIVLWGIDYRDYYLEFWRFNTLRVRHDVSAYLKSQMKRDSFIFFDSFPASNRILIANLLTRDLAVEEFEVPLRDPPPQNDTDHKVMIYRIPQFILEWYKGTPVDLWAVTELNAEDQERLFEYSRQSPKILVETKKNHTYLQFTDPQMPLWKKLDLMAKTFLYLEQEPQKRTDFHLISARALLIGGQWEEAGAQLAKAQQLAKEPFASSSERPPITQRILDPLLGLNARKIRQNAWDTFFYKDISLLLIRQGDAFQKERKSDQAIQFYEDSLKLSSAYRGQAIARISSVAQRQFDSGQWDEAVISAGRALRIDPERPDLLFLIAESYRKAGRSRESLETFESLLGEGSLSGPVQEKLMDPEGLLSLLKTESSLFLMFRANSRIQFAGRVESRTKIHDVAKRLWSSKADVKFQKNKMSFDLELAPGQIRILEIRTSKRADYSLDLKINGRRDPTKVIIFNSDTSLKNIPFTLD